MDCESVLRRSPSNLKAHWRAGKALLYLNRVREAKRHYRVAREICMNPVEERAIMEETKALHAYEKYYVLMKECRWMDSMLCAEQLLRVFGSTGSLGLPWHCRRLEALLNLDSRHALKDIKRLREEHAKDTELLFLHAKCLFYCAHDASSTAEVLRLVRAASSQKESEGGIKDSRFTHLERTVLSFERHRDRGNMAYEAGNWKEAHAAYTRCLSLDPLNRSLVAVAYCNRSAACVQGGRWDDALSDVHQSIQVNGSDAKAYIRRACIYLSLFEVKHDRGIDYLQLAINDLHRAVELDPTEDNRRQLAETLRMQREGGSRHEGSHNGDRHGNTDKSRNAGERFRSRCNDSQRGACDQGGGSQPKSVSVYSKTHCARILGLESSAALDVRSVAKAYHMAALQWHPDRWVGSSQRERDAAEQRFKEINMAYQLLKELIARG